MTDGILHIHINLECHPQQQPLSILRGLSSGNWLITRNLKFSNQWFISFHIKSLLTIQHPRHVGEINKVMQSVSTESLDSHLAVDVE